MAKANLKGALATEKIGKFGGICHGGSRIGTKKEKGSFNAFDIRNFRILPCGFLEKREGFRPLLSLPAEPRAFWSGSLDGDETAFALIGSSVYMVDLDGGKYELLGSIESAEGAAEFFFCHGTLYLADGDELYRFDGESFSGFNGYVPLYGKNMNGRYSSEVYEPINYLSDRIRMHYYTTDPTDTFYIGVKCKEILSFKVDGSDKLEKVSLTADGMSIYYGSADVAEKLNVEVCLRLDDSVCERKKLTSCKRAAVYGGSDDGRFILYGGSDPSRIFVTRSVSQRSLFESQISDVNSTEVYFPITDTVSVSDGRYGITALCRHYDRLLIFTEREAYMADFTAGGAQPYVIPINSSVGCLSENGAVLGGNSPYTASEGGIYRWTSNSDERNECNAICVSGEIGDMLGESFFDHAVSYYYRSRGEVWFADPDSEDQDVWIYSTSGQRWFRFDGIPVDRFFGYRNNVAMLYGRYIFTFSEDALCDTGAEGAVSSNIEAYYESNLTDFGYPERTKHIGRLLIKAELEGDPVSITLISDMGGVKTVNIEEDAGKDGKYATYLDARAGIGRFREMNFVIRSDGQGRTKIRSLTLTARK